LSLSVGLLRPDLTERSTGQVYEIKPVGSLAEGSAQLSLYLATLNALDPQSRLWVPGFSYLPPSFVPLQSGAIAIVFPPAAGVITYQVIDVREILATTLAYAAYRFYLSLNVGTLPSLAFQIPI